MIPSDDELEVWLVKARLACPDAIALLCNYGFDVPRTGYHWIDYAMLESAGLEVCAREYNRLRRLAERMGMQQCTEVPVRVVVASRKEFCARLKELTRGH